MRVTQTITTVPMYYECVSTLFRPYDVRVKEFSELVNGGWVHQTLGRRGLNRINLS